MFNYHYLLCCVEKRPRWQLAFCHWSAMLFSPLRSPWSCIWPVWTWECPCLRPWPRPPSMPPMPWEGLTLTDLWKLANRAISSSLIHPGACSPRWAIALCAPRDTDPGCTHSPLLCRVGLCVSTEAAPASQCHPFLPLPHFVKFGCSTLSDNVAMVSAVQPRGSVTHLVSPLSEQSYPEGPQLQDRPAFLVSPSVVFCRSRISRFLLCLPGLRSVPSGMWFCFSSRILTFSACPGPRRSPLWLVTLVLSLCLSDFSFLLGPKGLASVFLHLVLYESPTVCCCLLGLRRNTLSLVILNLPVVNPMGSGPSQASPSPWTLCSAKGRASIALLSRVISHCPYWK